MTSPVFLDLAAPKNDVRDFWPVALALVLLVGAMVTEVSIVGCGDGYGYGAGDGDGGFMLEC